jgi:hypothetical protein
VWGTFTNGCVLCTEVVHSIGAPLDTGIRELRLQEVHKGSCMIDCGLGILPRGYVNRKRAGTEKTCMPLFCAGVRPQTMWKNNVCKGNIQVYCE